MRHSNLVAVDPPGTWPRRWRCRHCQQEGTLSNLVSGDCQQARPVTDEELIEVIAGGDGQRSRS